MKYLAILICLCSALFCVHCDTENDEALKAMMDACKVETKATDADVEALQKHEAAGSPEAKCLRSCIMKKIGIMTEAGKLSEENNMQFIKILSKGDESKEKIAMEILNACLAIEVDAEHCEAAEQYSDCIIQNAKDMGFYEEAA